MRKVRSAVELKVGENLLKCSRCEEVKEMNDSNFYRTSHGSLGFQAVCKSCRGQYYKDNKEKRKEYQKNYWREHREYYLEYNKIYMKDKEKAKEFNLKIFKKQKNNKEKNL